MEERLTLEQSAYALLQGAVYDVRNMAQSAPPVQILAPLNSMGETILGRTPSDAASPPNFIHLSDKMSLSRKHACIAWNEASDCWEIRCLSKNGISVDRRALKPEDGPTSLHHRSAIRIGPAVSAHD